MKTMINGFFPGKLLPDATVAGCIDIYENAWPDPYTTIEMIEKECLDINSGISWSRAQTVGGGDNQDVRTNFNMGITYFAEILGNSVAQNIHNQMQMLMLATTIEYAKKNDIDALYPEGFNMLKYSGGQEYKAHADGSTLSGRSVSAIVYLNSDYTGGEIEFVNFGVKIKPEPGMLILFPSNYAYKHIAHPVTEGTKYAIVTWFKDRQIVS